MANTILGDDFLDWLKGEGIIPDHTTRVVIDAGVRQPVKIYIERFGTANLIKVQPPAALRTAIILGAEDPPKAKEPSS